MQLSASITRAVAAAAFLILVASACDATSDSTTLSSFRSNGVEYDFVSVANNQGPDAPCIGVVGHFESHVTATTACPTDDAATDTYGAVIEVDRAVFVVGYGLDKGETIDVPDATRVLVTEPVDDLRFFLLELWANPPTGTFEVVVARPDGGTRTIPAYASD